MKKIIVILLYCYIVILLNGCATVIEGAKGFVGISTKSLEDTRKNAIKKTFEYDYNTAFNKVKETLGHIGAYIYTQDLKKNMLGVYVSEDDTTSVGIFFKAIDSTHTQIEVSSLSTYAKEFIAQKISDGFNPEKEKGKNDVAKDTERK